MHPAITHGNYRWVLIVCSTLALLGGVVAQCARPTGYERSGELLNGNYRLYWTLRSSAGTIDVALNVKTPGWVAWGATTSSSPAMAGTEAIIGNSNRGDAQVFRLGSHEMSSFAPIDSSIPLTGVSACTYSDSGTTWTVVKFTRSLNSGQNKLFTDKATSIAVAFGSSTTLAQHSSSNRAIAQVNFVTGSITGEKKQIADKNYKIAHGALMFIGFTVLLPIGFFFARFGQFTIGESWFLLHLIFQLVGYAIAFAGFVIALWMVRKAHFKTKAHAQLGVSVVIAAVVQIALGFFRPHHAAAGEKPTTIRKVWLWIHRCFGIIIMIVAVISVFFGLHQYGVHFGWYIGYAIYVGLWVVLGIVLEIRQRFVKRKPEALSIELETGLTSGKPKKKKNEPTDSDMESEDIDASTSSS